MVQIADDRILREDETERETGLSRATRRREVREGRFPAPVQLTPSSIGWRKSDIDAWKASRRRVAWAPKQESAADQPSPV